MFSREKYINEIVDQLSWIYENGEITKEEYDEWRYSFPPIEAQRYDDIRAYYGIRKLSERGPDPFEGAEDIDLD